MPLYEVPVIELEQAVSRIIESLPEPQEEEVPMSRAPGRVLLETVTSAIDLPPFDNSAMDGYAVRAEDVAGAKPDAPIQLKVTGRVEAGQTFGGRGGPGDCVRLFTGSALPPGTDAVVMQEDTQVDPSKPAEVLILDGVKPWENVRLQGEDIRKGTATAEAGQILTPARVGLLSATGRARVKVGQKPRVALMATGSELAEPGSNLEPGKIYESNRLVMASLTESAGGIPKMLPLVPDNPGQTRAALESAFEQCDIVVSSGGVSVGEMDFVKQALEDCGAQLEFWKVNIRPGRPFVFGRREPGKFLFGLPGNPVSAFVTFLLLVRPALLRWQGASEIGLQSYPAVLGEALENSGNRRHFMRVKVRPDGAAFSAGFQASHVLGSLADANGLLDVPPASALAPGTTVNVLRW
jgi:molybdopterin molybdotransferase